MKILSIRKTFLVLILNALSIYGQGILKGLVIDSLTADQLKGAEIILTGTNFSATSNIDGEFKLTGIPTGEYILQASYLGYREKKYLIKIDFEETLKLQVELVPSVTTEDGTILTQQARDQAEEINQQIRSNTIKNVIARGKLQNLPDEDVTTALSRLPGVSVMHAPLMPINFLPSGFGTGSDQSIEMPFPPLNDFSLPDDPVSRVLIRGLDSKYGNITIDGIRISPTSAKNKSVDLNILSERGYQNIEVRKTITSDEDADATAGAINIATGKAPYTRMIKAEFMGNYNSLDKSGKQYNFTGSYGERFLDNALGIQANARVEKKIMSSEYQNGFKWFYSVRGLSYTNAVEERTGGNILLDFITPDGGTIKFNNILNKTNTDNFESEADSGFGLFPMHVFYDREIKKQLFLSSIEGTHYLFGFDVDWNAAFSESQSNHPFDYSLTFYGPMPLPPGLPFPLPYPDYLAYTLDTPLKNYCKEKTASLDIHKKYTISNEITGELKFGGKYRINSRSYDENSLAVGLPRHQILLSSFQDNPPAERSLLGEYEIPLINKNALLSWRQSNVSEYYSNNILDINSYNLSENVSAGYLMHNLNFGQSVKFITGLRIESEHNDYFGYYFPKVVSDPGKLYNDIPKQTNTFHYNKTTILPNFQMILEPIDFLNLRLAAYKTLIRPDCIARMPKYFSASYDDQNQLHYINMGNPDLKNADVWNYEFQTQFYGNDIGQLSVNAFYKNIEGMVQATNGMRITDVSTIDLLGINWRNYTKSIPFNHSPFAFYSYFNSPKPTRIWGFEIEHHASFGYLPGLLRNIVLNYNITFLRSETWTKDIVWITTTTTQDILVDSKQKLGDMPEFFLNVNLGYDIKGTSFRISYFYQDEYPMYDAHFGSSSTTQINKSKMSRMDVAVKQQILENISIILNLNNITNSKEEDVYKHSYNTNWKTAQAFRYGMNVYFGIGFNL